MRAVQAINYLQARTRNVQASGAQTAEGPAQASTPPGFSPPPPAPFPEIDDQDEPADVEPDTLEVGHEINVADMTIRCIEGDRPNLPPKIEILDAAGRFVRHAQTVPAALDWLQSKYPQCVGERLETRATPTLGYPHHSADQAERVEKRPAVIRRRKR